MFSKIFFRVVKSRDCVLKSFKHNLSFHSLRRYNQLCFILVIVSIKDQTASFVQSYIDLPDLCLEETHIVQGTRQISSLSRDKISDFSILKKSGLQVNCDPQQMIFDYERIWWETEKMLVTSMFSFSHHVSEFCLLAIVKYGTPCIW